MKNKKRLVSIIAARLALLMVFGIVAMIDIISLFFFITDSFIHP